MTAIEIKHDARLTLAAHFCIPDDQECHIPSRRRAPRFLPIEAPLPRTGEIVYLSSTSAWVVSVVIHEWKSLRDLRVEIWLEYAGAARARRSQGAALTQ